MSIISIPWGCAFDLKLPYSERSTALWGDIAIAEVKPESVLGFVAGTGPITARWIENHRVLGGFYRYAVGRGFATLSPLPTDTPRPPTQLTPYIYTGDELKRVLAT